MYRINNQISHNEAILNDFEQKEDDFYALILKKGDDIWYTNIYTNTNDDLVTTFDNTKEDTEIIDNCTLTLSINNVETYFDSLESLYIFNDKYIIITIENSKILLELKDSYDFSITHIVEPHEKREIIINIKEK